MHGLPVKHEMRLSLIVVASRKSIRKAVIAMDKKELVAEAVKLSPAERRLQAYREGKVKGILASDVIGEF